MTARPLGLPMANLPEHISRPDIKERLTLMAVAAFVYVAVPIISGESRRPIGHFPQLAQAFLQGSFSFEIPPDSRRGPDELIPNPDPSRYYCAYPPLPAVLLLPFVAVIGTALKVETACRVVSVVNIFLFAACIRRLPRRLGMTPLEAPARVALNVLFAFGTVCWHNAEIGGDWHLAHAVALAAMLLAMREWLAGNRPFVIGCFVGLAILTRPTAALSGLFFIIPLVRTRVVPQLVKLSAGPAFAILLFALYNNARFGSPFDFGYDRMLLRGLGAELMREYGQFHPRFVPGNAFWFFLAPPWPTAGGRFPFVGYDPHGLSLFLATPAFLYVFAAFKRHRRCVYDAAVGIAACLVPLLLYFNTGFAQFGHRFSMDYLPLVMVLVVAGMGSRPGKLAYFLVAASVAIQAIGVLLDPQTTLPPWLMPSP